ncbi:MAG TPA: helix-turn-helix transcriptional regulator [Lacibacter sp.]|nr:helix-turn-helix transcriptional regulator [Lacibacter sp.]HMO87624.1 helix-turn-helix transcriptional regulator [Lacibacter sp.]HMP87939.1 helix-turn-helix transcriptional regulator [Lacibacter sp.]
MITIDYNDTSYKTLYPKIAAAFSTEFKDNRIVLPKGVGSGYLELLNLGDELYASVRNFTADVDVKFCRSKRADTFYILHFDELRSGDQFMVKIDGTVINSRGRHLSNIMMTCNHFDFCYMLPAETTVRSVYIILTQNWIRQYMELDDNDEIFKTYLSLRSEHLNREPFNTDYRKYFNEVFETPENKPLRELHLRNAIMMLIEIFFTRLHRRIRKVEDSPIQKMNPADLHQLMEVESLLVKDFSRTPPTIADLAARANMSVSKLKTSFKRIYGTGIYEYYQKNRMHRARQLLASNGCTVKEVGMKLGYTNLSNFSLAFKKEFGILPSEL